MAYNRNLTEQHERWLRTSEGMYFDEKEKELLITSLRLKTGEKILEPGCGTGRYIRYFNEIGLEAHGIEPVEELIKLAAMKTDIPEDRIKKGNMENLPYKDVSFDCVIFMTTLEYASDKAKALKEAYRVSRSRIAVVFLNKNASMNFIKYKRRRGLTSDADFFSSGQLKKFAERALLSELDRIDIKIRHTVFLPPQIGRFVPFVDTVLEKLNLPFGNIAILVIKKR
ncbi:MAG: class I SAM-dependent methyltransferase [Candidatus Goldiibacteriota bacterium]